MSTIENTMSTENDIKKGIEKGIETATDDLKKVLTFKDLVLLGLGNIVGAGIFVILGKTVQFGGKYTLGVFGLISIMSIIMGYMYIEIHSRYRSETMEYDSIKDQLGNTIGNIALYMIYMFAIVSTVTIVTSMSKYLCSYGIFGHALERHRLFQIVFSIILLGIMAIINYVGIDTSKMVSNVIGGVMLLLIIGIIVSSIPSFNWSKITSGPSAPMNSYVLSAIIAIFLFNGYDFIVKMSRETINEEDTEKSMSVTILLTTIIYILLIVSCICVIGYSNIVKTIHPLTTIYEMLYSKRIAIVTFIIGAFIMFNTAFLSHLCATRFLYGCAIKKTCKYPDFFSSLSSYKTPTNAIIISFVISVLFAILHNEVLMAIFSNFTTLSIMIAMTVSLLMIRWKERHEPEKKHNYFPLNIRNIPVPLVAGLIILLFFTGTIVKNKFFI